MSHDFPDGPDFNPEPLDDDPWDVDTTSYPQEACEHGNIGLVCPACGSGPDFDAWAERMAQNDPQDAA